MLIFEQSWGKPEYPEKNLSEQGREPTTNSTHIVTYGIDNRVWNQDMLVGGKCSHYYALLSPLLHLAVPFVIYSGIVPNKLIDNSSLPVPTLYPYTQYYSRTPLFRTRLIRSPCYFEGRSNSLGFTLPLYASPVISKPRYFELFFHFPWDFQIAGFYCSSASWKTDALFNLISRWLFNVCCSSST